MFATNNAEKLQHLQCDHFKSYIICTKISFRMQPKTSERDLERLQLAQKQSTILQITHIRVDKEGFWVNLTQETMSKPGNVSLCRGREDQLEKLGRE